MHVANGAEHFIPEADWKTIDRTIAHLARKKGEIEVEIGRWLLAAQRERVDRRCGYGSFSEYVERRLGYDARLTREKLKVARKLEGLPRTRALLHSGARAWSAVREMVRVATPDTEAAWIEKTERMTVRQIERLIAGRKEGDLPTDEPDPLLAPRRMIFDLAPEDFALITEAFEKVRQQIGPAASRTEVLRAMAEVVLCGRPEGEPAYQTSLTLCASCERTWQAAGGDLVEVSAANGDCARCDAEIVGFTEIDPCHATADQESADPTSHVGGEGEVLRAESAHDLLRLASRIFGVPHRSVTPRLRAAVRARDRGRCVVPGFM